MSYIKQHFDPKRHSIFIPKFPQKYGGRDKIICRSSWETIFCQWCDNNQAIVKWSSECIAIPYKHPYKKQRNGLPKTAHYYPDFLVIIEKAGITRKYLIEVKPSKETKPPRNGGNKSAKTRLYEQKSWAVNKAKWIAAERYCNKMGYIFKKVTEKELIA
jgi:hypothetical protein